jgi:hypothetical protein
MWPASEKRFKSNESLSAEIGEWTLDEETREMFR